MVNETPNKITSPGALRPVSMRTRRTVRAAAFQRPPALQVLRALLLILSLVAAPGCTHMQKPWSRLRDDETSLEQAVYSLQQEVVLLRWQLEHKRADVQAPEAARRRRTAASMQAHDNYSQAQRIRDLRALIDILDRRVRTLSAEVHAYNDGVDYN